MGMSTSIVGYRDLSEDSEFQRMMDVKLACEKAGISYPKEVEGYFEFPSEGEDLLRREKSHIEIGGASSVDVDALNGEQAWLIDITKLPEGCTKIRVSNSW